MKLKIGLLALILISSTVSFHNATASGNKVWIFFKGRPYLNSSSARVSALSPEALSRRALRGTTQLDESDFAVDSGYIESVKQGGAKIYRTSRWLNAISAECDARCRQKVSSLPFVVEIKPVAVYRRAIEKIHNEPFRVEKELNPATPNALNYGSSLTQLKQIKIPVLHNRGFAGQGEIVAVFDTGFRKDHEAFRQVTLLGEKDFVFDDTNVTNGGSIDSHGTGTWSAAGAASPGKIYGGAYKARFLLAATEDVRSETRVEEDNWVAALEWADSLGATVISSSLGYSDWYSPSDFNGSTAVTSRAASAAASKGIVVVNSAGNSGSDPSTLIAPADARNILAVGAVDSGGNLATFSSRGPTADGRLKPEVVAQGVQTFLASEFSTNSYGRSSGTSFSCPLIAGAAAALLSAHPEWRPLQVREAFIKTASRSTVPDNNFGYGLANMEAALNYVPINSIVIDQHKPLVNTTNATSPYPVTARIRAFRGLNTTQIFLLWKRSGTSTFQKILMTPVPNIAGKFQAAIPAQPKGTTILYFLQAKDSAGKVQKSPANAPTTVYKFGII